ncbi:hypothetical protein V500_02247 [Pseudogymnoascus sp. VKM F-4518 (FW-2643)]|nr:hypothetical protein V500_02247 [Pseudogymnoascus sp. VKM F-4518 (FW-2643)]
MSNVFPSDEHAYKKPAIGMGKSPSSSHTQGSGLHTQALPASRCPASSPSQGKVHDPMDFASRGPSTPGKRLFNPSEATSPQASNLANSQASQQLSPTLDHSRMVSQPETRPISQEQLVAEVKGIYVGLTPASLDYMLAFIYLTYSMMALLLETVPAFEDTWIQCLSDNSGPKSRASGIKSANRPPTTGRLYHHPAILARPDALPQLLYYGKSLAVTTPFTAARETIMTLFEPTLNPAPRKRRFSAVITAIVRSHAIIFTGEHLDTFDETLGEITTHLDGRIVRITKKYLEQGYYIAISNCIALLGYGAEDKPLAVLMEPNSDDFLPHAEM